MPPEELTPEVLKAEVLQTFATLLAETSAVVGESVLNRRPEVQGGTLQPADTEMLQDTFAALPHVAIEMRVALSPSEAYLATAMLTRPALAGLLRAEALAEVQGSDALTEESAAAVVELLTGKAREYVDLLTLMLFTDSPVRGEISLSEVRFGEVETTVGMLLDTAAGAPLYRLDVDATFPDGDPAGLTLLMPAPLIAGLVAGLSEEPETDAGDAGPASPEPTPIGTPLSMDAAGAADPGQASGAGAISLGGLDDALAGFDEDLEEDDGPVIPVTPVQFADLGQGRTPAGPAKPLDLLLDVSMRISVELGRAALTVQELLALGPGSVVELDKLAGEPVDVLVNDRLIARGEVVMVDENFGVRVTEILAPSAAPMAAGA